MSSLAVRHGAPVRTARPALVVTLALAGVLFGLAAGQFVAASHSTTVAALALVLLPWLMWRRPGLAPAVLVLGALTVEQFGQRVEPVSVSVGAPLAAVASAHIPVTSHVPLFYGISSLHIAPADLLLLATFLLYLVKTESGSRPWPRSTLTAAVAALTGVLVLGLAIGLAHHGTFRTAMMEARPYIYLAATYMLASVLITSRKALRAVLWGMVIATGLKAFQGLYVFLSVRHMHPRPEAILGHEEAFFFGLFIFLTLALWLFDVRGRLRTTATWLLPVVMAANLANNRRAAWVVLAGGLMVLTAIGLRYLPSRRALLSRAVAVVLVVSAVYFPTYWNHTGTLAQPARALRSAVAPDPRDASSDLYRIQENANLNLNIKEAGLLGKGFGVPIDYALPIADLTGIDPLITYIPHNGVLYVLMRMGLLGGVALWAVLASGIISGCRLARSVDRELAVVGALLAAALIGWALEGALDQGFFFYRIAFVVGSLLGLAEAASRLPQAVPRSGP